MICPRLRRVLLIGLGIVAGAVLPAPLVAQVPVRPDTARAPRDTAPTRVDSALARQVRGPQRRDTIRVPTPPKADSMVKNDSIIKGVVPLPARADSVKRDTIKPPLTRAEGPPILAIGPPRIYDRSAMFATGALTLSDLLGRLPGATEFATGWLAAPAAVASQGDLRLVRVFLDGIELDPLERRGQGISPINDLALYNLEELRIERGVEEIRVYARSWRVNRTDPYTRADIGTGDQSTNLYRAFFGRRYDHGEALQIAAEQYSTQPNRQLPLTDVLRLTARVGTTHGPWSVDLFAERTDADRGKWVGTGNFDDTRDTVAALQNRRITAYARLGNGDPESGRWFQLLAAGEGYRGSPHLPAILTTTTTTDANEIPDSTMYEQQYLVTGGLTVAGVRLSAAERIRRAYPRTSHVLSGRASFATPWISASGFAEGKSALYPARAEGTVKLSAFDRVAIVASGSRTGAGLFTRMFGVFENTPVLGADGVPSPTPVVDSIGAFDPDRVSRFYLNSRTNLRAEGGIRLYDVWVSGGVMRRGATTLLPAADFQAAASDAEALRTEGAATAATAAVRGRLYRALNVDAWAVRWNDSTGLYRPQYQTRAELFIQTNLLKKFPRGNFGLLGSLAHEYRSNVYFAMGDSVRVAQGFRRLDFKLEIRIQSAVVSYQFRNLLQERYAEVPGFFMPRQTQFYGVRWDFWN